MLAPKRRDKPDLLAALALNMRLRLPERDHAAVAMLGIAGAMIAAGHVPRDGVDRLREALCVVQFPVCWSDNAVGYAATSSVVAVGGVGSVRRVMDPSER